MRSGKDEMNIGQQFWAEARSTGGVAVCFIEESAELLAFRSTEELEDKTRVRSYRKPAAILCVGSFLRDGDTVPCRWSLLPSIKGNAQLPSYFDPSVSLRGAG